MLFFISKKVQVIDKNMLILGNEEKLYVQVKTLFRESNCETILIYENNKYCGYINRDNMYDIVLPEFYLGFEPVELQAGEGLMEIVMELRESRCVKKTALMIPMKRFHAGDIRDFVVDEKCEAEIGNRLNAVKNFDKYIQKNRVSFSWGEEGRKMLQLPELDEFTYIFYKVIRQMNQKDILTGKYWSYINADNENICESDETETLECNYYCIIELLQRFAKEKISEEINRMRQAGTKAYKVIIPSYNELAVHGKLEEQIRNELGTGVVELRENNSPNRQFYIEQLLKTEQCDSEEELLYSEHPKQYGEEEATIYLAGPCVVQGYTTTERASIAYMLYSRLLAEGMKYNVVRLAKIKSDITLVEELQALDLRENDMIFFITDSQQYSVEPDDIYLLEEYDHRRTDEWWFADVPIHTFRRANEMITDKLYSVIELQYKRKSDENKFIQAGKPVLSCAQEEELERYIRCTERRNIKALSVGAVVMNANPFTRGHLYLLEKAAAEVEELLVFVVEEDLSEFSFADRIMMVRNGIAHLRNVRVIPSGKFILSSYTFVSYFEKDRKQDVRVDAALDINFFGTYIVPAFRISKRFVGEEPIDKVTRQYNEEMKRKLPLFGVEVIEIPRKTTGNDIISATVVRRLYRKKDWKGLTTYLPDSTLTYLKQYNVVMREKNHLYESENVPEKFLNGLRDILFKYKKIVFYGMGIDGRGLYCLLNEDEKEKIVFCDKRAEAEEYFFIEGKKVYEPATLLNKFVSYPVLVTSTQYGSQIRAELHTIGVSVLRIIQNMYSFYQG